MIAATIPEKFARAPFPYFGGKRSVAALVWERLGRPKQYIEPFAGSAAMLLGAPEPASLEVIGDTNFYVANFWRCIKFCPRETYGWQDYPVSHVDLDARHRWLTQPERTSALRAALADPEWPGDPQIAGWWVWGLCAWIGSGWCERVSKIPHVGNAGQGVQSKIPHVGNAGRGVQSQIPHVGNAGRGVADWFAHLARRLERVRVIHGAWDRTLNHHYGGAETAVFLDPPYRAFEGLYQQGSDRPIADSVAAWAAEHAHLRVALCGHRGDYDLSGWEVVEWSRERNTYGGAGTKDEEAIWFSPACLRAAAPRQASLFDPSEAA